MKQFSKVSNRISRVNQLIKKELGKILLYEGNFPKDSLVTLTRVETSADLREAKVWVSVFPEKEAKKILSILNQKIFDFQQKLNKTLKIKFVPKLKFLIEEKTKTAARIEELLERAKEES